MGKLKEMLAGGKPLLWDGGMGTQIIARGLSMDSAPELFNVEKPGVISDIHTDYYNAGAVAAQSNTFGGHPMKLDGSGLAERARELNIEGMKRVVEARPEGCLAVGDIGPCGAMLPPSGTADASEVREGFLLQAKALSEGGADVIHIETMFDIEEMKLALDAALETGLEVMTSMTFNRTPRGFFTIMGVNPERAVKELADAGATVVGANCSIGPEAMVELVRELKQNARTPIIAQANAGRPRVDGSGGAVGYDVTAGQYAGFTIPILNAGADIIGGCCGTTPEFIAAMAEKIASR